MPSLAEWKLDLTRREEHWAGRGVRWRGRRLSCGVVWSLGLGDGGGGGDAALVCANTGSMDVRTVYEYYEYIN